MKKRKWYSVSKTFVIVLIAILVSYALIPGYIWLKWHGSGILAFLRGDPVTSSQTESYYNADFGVILHSSAYPHFSKVIFYKVNEFGKAEQVYRISFMKPSAGRPTFVRTTKSFYFPHFATPGSNSGHGYVTVLKEYKARTLKTESYCSEFVAESGGKILIDIGGTVSVFDKSMRLIGKIPDKGGRSVFQTYQYEGKIFGIEVSKTDTYLIGFDPDKMKTDKIIRYDFPLVPDGNHCAIVRFKGKVYAFGYDAPLIPGTYVHKVIYELTDRITPAYVFPKRIKLCNSIKNCDPKIIYSNNPDVEFGFESFVPVDPENKEFALLGRTSLLSGHPESYIYLTKEKKFFKVPSSFVKGEDFAYDTRAYVKGHIFIATDRYLLEFDGSKFEIADTFSKSDKYESVIFPTTW